MTYADDRNNPSSQEYVNANCLAYLRAASCETCKVFKELCKCGKYDKDGKLVKQ